MQSKLEQPIRLVAALAFALSACKVDLQDGVFACAVTSDCPSGFRCDPVSKHCTRQPPRDAVEEADASARGENTGAVKKSPQDAGHENQADAAEHKDAGVGRSGRDPSTAGRGGSTAGDPGLAKDMGTAGSAGSAGNVAMQQEQARAGTGGSERAAGGAGAAAEPEQAGAAAHSGTGGSADPPPSDPGDCPQDTYCYGFEPGPLDPSGALWPSPIANDGDIPPYGQLTTTTYPAGSQNKVLVSRPSAKDNWPKATVGFTGPVSPQFSKLVVSFDYVAGDKLSEPNPRVIVFRFVGTPDINGDSVNVGLLKGNAMLEVQNLGNAPLTTIGPATAPGTLTHVVATFTRKPPSCNVEVVYGALQPMAAAFPCKVEHWNVEIGLDMLEISGPQYTQDYSAFYDNLRISSTP